MIEANTAYIYTLSDPETLAVRYVGKTINPASRQKDHQASAKAKGCVDRRTGWIKSLAKRGLLPLMTVVDSCALAMWPEREMYWIAHYRAAGCDLTNLDDGGYGLMCVSAETRLKLSAITAARNRSRRGIPLSEERRARLSAIHKARLASLTPEQKMARVSAALLKHKPGFNAGWKHTAETRAVMSVSAKRRGPTRVGWRMSEEHKAKIGAANSGTKAEKALRKALKAA